MVSGLGNFFRILAVFGNRDWFYLVKVEKIFKSDPCDVIMKSFLDSFEHFGFLFGGKTGVGDEQIGEILFTDCIGICRKFAIEFQAQNLILQLPLELEKLFHCQNTFPILAEKVRIETSVDALKGRNKKLYKHVYFI